MSDYLFHVFLSYRKQRSYKPSSDLPVLWIEASKLWQVRGKIPFDKNPSAQGMLKFHLTYSRPCINSDSPEKVAQKAAQRGKKRINFKFKERRWSGSAYIYPMIKKYKPLPS